MMENFFYINGEFVPANEAKVHVFDHGFLYGDGIFDSFPLRNGRIFKFDEHIDRLYRSAKIIMLEIPMTKAEMKQAVIETLRKSKCKDAFVKIVVSRGAGSAPVLDPRLLGRPTVVIMHSSKEPPPEACGTYAPPPEKGLRTIIPSIRRVTSVDQRAKTCNYLNNVMARIEAIVAGVDEAILLDTNDFVSEGTADNVFIVNGGIIYTPPPTRALAGITRQTIIELARKEGYDVVARDLTRYDLYTADEVFLTSSYILDGVTPVAEIDGRKIGKVPGPVTKKLREVYKRLLESTGTPI